MEKHKKIIYSGVQPTGAITLGNYIGALRNWLQLQDDESFLNIYSIVDLHSLTIRQKPKELRDRILSFYAQYLACGLDPNKNILYIQSHVPAHAELQWILSCFTYVGEMSRMTQFKDKSSKNEDNINMGLMNYPVLMASDILLYNTSLVPIGIDQKQHMEIARDIAIRFNNIYGKTFVVPDGYFPKLGAKIMSLQEPTAKMSKSDDNPYATINILDTNDQIKGKIKRAVTDSLASIKYDTVNQPGVSNLLTIYATCTGISIEDACKNFDGKGYGDLKKEITDAVISITEPVRDKYNHLMSNKDEIMNHIKDGAYKANEIASSTLSRVHDKIGLLKR